MDYRAIRMGGRMAGLLLCALSARAEVNLAPEVTKLHAIFDAQWQQEMQLNPTWASSLGDRRYNRQWTDLSPEGRAQRRQSNLTALDQAQTIDRELLDQRELVNLELFTRAYQQNVDSDQFATELMPITQRGGIQTLDDMANRLRMTQVTDFEDWLARLDKIDVHMRQTIALMAEGIDNGMVPPKITMQRVPAQIKQQLVTDPAQSLFFKPFNTMPASISSTDQARLRDAALRIISAKVIPAYQKLYSYFTETYLPACRDSIAASDLPNGKVYYEHVVRQFTTTELTPEEVHQLGLQEVSRIRSEMNQVIASVGFEGSFSEFLTFLRTDPQFYYKTPEALFEGYLAITKRIDPHLVTLFNTLPRMPYGVKAIPDAIAPDTTTAYYHRPAADGSRAGYYFVNLYKPETRPKYEMEVLSVHEAVPGHHLQIALQQELEDLPNFRRYSGFTVFTEGWGLYSERLGYDLGLYTDPYSRFGQLSYDMWRAVRLVVDTGMHYKGWSRQRAIDYFSDNAPKTKLDIINEIDRYISWPGQALAYKLGQLKISELRARAEQKLGDKFDIKDFHDTLLANGSSPLSVLETIINDWITLQLSSATHSH
jgi:uncharacterized protein (DUF885 family)